MTERYFLPACVLIDRTQHPPDLAKERNEAEQDRARQKVENFPLAFSQRLSQTRDLTPLIKEFFVPNYLDRFVQDRDANVFSNLTRETREQASPSELERYYLATLNAGYLGSVYLISRPHRVADTSGSGANLVPADIMRLVRNHSDTATHKSGSGDYEYLAETLNRVERLRRYTDLLEKINFLLRRQVQTAHAERSAGYRRVLDDMSGELELYSPIESICKTDCLGLPKGTTLYDVSVPMLRLRFAEVKGEFKIVTALPLAP